VDNDREEADDLDACLAPTPLPWQAFEAEVAGYIQKALDGRELGIDNGKARVTPKYPLFSRDRESNIIFDVALQVFSALDSTTPVFVWLWECKNYPSHRVTVDEVEEFHSKITQVGAHKGTMVTRMGFQSGAIAFAKSRGIGLMTLNKQRVRAFAMSQDCGIMESDEIIGEYCLYTFGMEVEGPLLRTLIDFGNSDFRRGPVNVDVMWLGHEERTLPIWHGQHSTAILRARGIRAANFAWHAHT